jgi:nucleosome binding factor SPN SPT16 subunit
MLSFIKDGRSTRDVFNHALEFVKSKRPEIEKNFVKNVGFGTGIEIRDSAYSLSPKNNRNLKTDMILSLNLGFTDLTDATGKKYALQLNDTIRVGVEKSVLLTEGSRSAKDTLFFLTGDDEDEEPVKVERTSTKARPNGSPVKKVVGGKMLRNQPRRAVQDEVHTSAAARLAEHQRELHDRLQTEGIQRFSEGGSGQGGKEGKGWKKFQSYKGEAALPAEVERLRVCFMVETLVHFLTVPFIRLWSIAKRRRLYSLFMGMLFRSISMLSRMQPKQTREILQQYESTFKLRVSWLARKRIPRSRTRKRPLSALSRIDRLTGTVSTTCASK